MTNPTPAPAVPVLPPLPAPDTTWYASWSDCRVKFHSADQIYEFANARVKAALEASRLAGQGEAWQPIETVQRSAGEILVFTIAGFRKTSTGAYAHHLMNAARIDGDVCHFTHWQPLPPPPAISAKGQAS